MMDQQLVNISPAESPAVAPQKKYTESPLNYIYPGGWEDIERTEKERIRYSYDQKNM